MGAQPSFVADDPRFVEMIRATQENGEVERIDTHGAAVFLVGRFA
jgi:hypothetical protein